MPGLEGVEDAREAGNCIERARARLDREEKQLMASLDLAEGVWNTVMALKGMLGFDCSRPESKVHLLQNRIHIPSDAHSLFLRAAESHPSSSGHVHLALSFARPSPVRDLSLAIENAGLAVEGDPKEIRYWHLLGLLLAATEQWKAAGEILERGGERLYLLLAD